MRPCLSAEPRGMAEEDGLSLREEVPLQLGAWASCPLLVTEKPTQTPLEE
jgi:hypothetical protein